jgi:hypothetical protein
LAIRDPKSSRVPEFDYRAHPAKAKSTTGCATGPARTHSMMPGIMKTGEFSVAMGSHHGAKKAQHVKFNGIRARMLAWGQIATSNRRSAMSALQTRLKTGVRSFIPYGRNYGAGRDKSANTCVTGRQLNL